MPLLIAALALADPALLGEVPFELVGGQMWVRISVDGREVKAIVDTGAGASVMDPKVAKFAKPVGGVRKGFTGVGGGVVGGRSTKGRDFRLGETSVLTPIFDVLDLSSLGPDDEHPMEAVLGYHFFRPHVVEIDYPAHLLRVYDAARYRPPKEFVALPFQFIDGTPTVFGAVRLEGTGEMKATVQFDTGSAFGIDLGNSLVRREKLAQRFKEGSAFEAAGGLGGMQRTRAVGDATARLGELHVPGPARLILTKRAKKWRPLGLEYDYDVSLGTEVLQKYRLVFDYPHSRVYVRRESPEPPAIPEVKP